MAIKIFVDQGHNPSGPNTGAEGSGLLEQDVTYAVGVYLADLLRADPRFEVRLSRSTPEEILGTSNATSLAERVRLASATLILSSQVRLANEWPADYFISIHCNANVNPAINGTEVYVYRENTQAYWLAQHVLAGIVARVGTRDNGVRVRPSLYVLRRTQMPAILVELAYLTNTSDAMKLENDPFGFAQGIYNGLLSYFDLEPY